MAPAEMTGCCWNQDFGDECVVVRNESTKIEVRTPAYPDDCTYVRVVVTDARAEDETTGEVFEGECELVYWCVDEWQEKGEDVMGAIMAVVKQVAEGHTFEVEFGYRAFS